MVHAYQLIRNFIHSLVQNSQKTRDNILAFTCGDIMLFKFLGIPPDVAAFGEKMLSAFVLTLVGGAGGWLGKELIIWTWKQIKRICGKIFKTNK